MTHTITVYTKPACVQCKFTFKVLDENEADYTPLDVSTDDEAMETVKGLGYLAAPVVVITDAAGNQLDHWSGFQPDRIRKYL